MNKFTKQEAQEHSTKIIECDNKYQRSLRLLLIEALQKEAHKALGLASFEDYLETLSPKMNSMSSSKMRRHANAGLIELEILGIEGIGSICEGALRVLSEKVTPEKRREVYDSAFKSSDGYPTSTQLIEAAEKLKLYKKESSKEKSGDNKTTGKKRASNNDLKSNDNSKNVKKLDYMPEPESKSSKVVDINKLSPKKQGRKLVEMLGVDGATILAYMLEGAMDETVYKEYIKIRNHNSIKEWQEIIAGIDDALSSKKSKKVTVN